MHTPASARNARRAIALAFVLLAGAIAWVPAPAAAASLTGRKIFVDPGHGGNDGGACALGACEKTLTLAVGLKLRDFLQAEGATVKLSRTTDVTLTPSQRVGPANAWPADRFVSIHMNSCGGCGGHGTETYVLDTCCTANQLATKVQPEVVKLLGTTNRGVKTANFFQLRDTTMPAILVEVAFIDYEAENTLLRSTVGQCNAARAILHGIQQHFGAAIHDPFSCTTTPPPPAFTVTLVSPTDGVFVRGNVLVKATTNQDGSLEYARVLIDGVVKKTFTPAPHEWTWPTPGVADGTHTVKAEAKNTAGTIASDSATVTVDNTAPTALLTQPAAGASYVNGVEVSTAAAGVAVVVGPLVVRVTGNDATSGLDRALFYLDGALILTAQADEDWSWTWNQDASATPGPHTLSVQVLDHAGNMATVTRTVDVRAL